MVMAIDEYVVYWSQTIIYRYRLYEPLLTTYASYFLKSLEFHEYFLALAKVNDVRTFL